MTPIACICCTYGRVSHLNEALACFLAQDYEGPHRLIILNTLAAQELEFDHPQVTIVNASERPRSMGATRNMAIELAPDDSLLVVWDDDDIYCPNYLTTLVHGFDPAVHQWTRLTKQGYMEGTQLKGIVQGSANTFAFTKKAWRAVGKYSEINVGEDRQIIGRIASQFQGNTVQMADSDSCFIYRWGTGVWHLSGKGDDGPKNPNALDDARKFVGEQLGCFREPQGVVNLNPKLKQDYTRLLQQFTASVKRLINGRRGKVGFVCLGHTGDIINVLPIVKHVHDVTGSKPMFYTTEQYGHVLDGTGYCQPFYMAVEDHRVNEVLQVAARQCEIVLCPQMHGDHAADFPRETDSYNIEQWRLLGFRQRFNEWPLTFDERNAERENQLVDHHLGHLKDKPIVLLHLTGGLSSPWPEGKKFQEHIVSKWGHAFHFVDLAPIKAHRLFDMLALFDRADLLISADTYPLHLAAASSVPVFAITNDSDRFGKDWLATRTRFPLAGEARYNKELAAYQKVDDCLATLVLNTFHRRPLASCGTVVYAPKFFHSVEVHPDRGEAESRRKKVARDSWQTLYSRGMVPCPYSEYKRTARDIGDARDLPFLKDVLEPALAQANPDDCIVWTNDDIILHPELLDILRVQVGIWDACTSMRVEFKTETVPHLTSSPEEMAARGEVRHMGRDLMAAKASWFRRHWNELPDAIIGAPAFDLHLAAFVRHTLGHRTTRQNIADRIPCCELPHGYVIHQHHPSVWAALPQNTPSHVHNGRLFREWSAKALPELKFYGNMI